MKIIHEPINNIFFELVSSANRSIKLCAPFVKSAIINELCKLKNPGCSLSLVTQINLMNFYKNASDISAIKSFQENNGEVYNFQRLHAKFYIFDDKYTMITSANLTPSGFRQNYEYGVYIEEKDLVAKTSEDFVSLCRNESTGKLKIDHSNKIERILNTIPKAPKIDIPKLDLIYDNVTDEIFDKDIQYVVKNLSGWKKSLFSALHLLQKQVFSTTDFPLIVPTLKKQYPENHTIEAKIRQQLQQLRDLGLIKFEGNGVYKKLWE